MNVTRERWSPSAQQRDQTPFDEVLAEPALEGVPQPNELDDHPVL